MKWLCKVVEIARSSFYAWLAAADTRAAKAAADQELEARIRVVHTAMPSGSTTSGWPG